MAHAAVNWNLLCFWHFWIARLRGDKISWCDVHPEDVNDHCDWKGCSRKPYMEVYKEVSS
jgi:hypothetical protein